MNEKELITHTIKTNPELRMPDIAKLLGCSLRTLRKRIEMYSIETGRKRGRKQKPLTLVR